MPSTFRVCFFTSLAVFFSRGLVDTLAYVGSRVLIMFRKLGYFILLMVSKLISSEMMAVAFLALLAVITCLAICKTSFESIHCDLLLYLLFSGFLSRLAGLEFLISGK